MLLSSCSCSKSRKAGGFDNASLGTCFLGSCSDSQQGNSDGSMVKAWQVWGKESSVLQGLCVEAGKLSGCFPACSRGICFQHACNGRPVPLQQKQMEHGNFL